MRSVPKGKVCAVGEMEEHDHAMPCEACAEDVYQSAPASNAGRLCVYCVQDCYSRGGYVDLWMPKFMRENLGEAA